VKRREKSTTSLFGIRSHFEFASAEKNYGVENIFEERIIIVRAASHDEALRMGEAEADNYCETYGVRSLKYIESFEVFEERLKLGVEVFSHLRGTQLDEDRYLKTYFHGHDLDEPQRRFVRQLKQKQSPKKVRK
jgi:hypothetical protein